MKKTTLATIKRFIVRESKINNLYIKQLSAFDGMIDGTREINGSFDKVDTSKINLETRYTFGIFGAWFVGQSRDYFIPYSDDLFIGYKVYNCCGSFILAMDRKGL